MQVSKQNPVIIAGAGPVGLSFALYLAQRDIPVRVLEAEPSLPITLRASTWHPPTLDMMDSIGLGQALAAIGLKVPHYQQRERGTDLYAQFDLGVLADETNHPYRLQVEQFRMTQMAQTMLQAIPCAEIQFGTVVETVWQDSDFVMVKIRDSQGIREFRAPYLLGADGASSNIRVSSGIGFEGFTYPEKFLIVSTPYPLHEHIKDLAYVSYFADPEEWLLTLRCNNLWRVMVPTQPGADAEQLIADDNVQAVLQRLVSKTGAYDIGHKTIYNVNQRVASQFRKGRVFLAGDAAHVNNPLGGMGMNGGIHDAFNLAEKMVAVVQEQADEALFDVYDRQRRTVTSDFIQRMTINNKEQLENKDPHKTRKQIEALQDIIADPQQHKAYLRETSMFNSLQAASEIE